jgi:glycerol uptake facilitator-like aquaporin
MIASARPPNWNCNHQSLGAMMPAFSKPDRQTTPFFEGRDCPSLTRRALAEGVATAALTMSVVFAVQASWLGTLRPLARGIGIPAALAALTLAFGPATGAHFNPLVTASQWVRGHRDTRSLIAYVIAQLLGALVGAAVAGWLVGPAPHAAPASLILVVGSEIFASAGLVAIVLATSLVTGPFVGLLAVIGWLVMINLIAPAGPFANPVLAFAAPLGLRSMTPSVVLAHVSAEVVGAGFALLLIAVTYPRAPHLATSDAPVLTPETARSS